VVLMAVGICGSSVYQREAQLRLVRGETARVGPYTITYHGAQIDESPLRHRMSAEVIVTRGDRGMTFLRPAQDLYPAIDQRVTRVAIRSWLDGDLYVVLNGIEGHPGAASSIAHLRILHNPLVIWIWIGGALMLVGGLLTLRPQRGRDG
jgi:cytochrome c-type biogenesis protein CcmF